MNPYLETLKDELREDCGEDICQADWDCFWNGVEMVDHAVAVGIKMGVMSMSGKDDFAAECAAWSRGTRADLPSIVKYAYAAIEENLK